jgi:hypothetical protein
MIKSDCVPKSQKPEPIYEGAANLIATGHLSQVCCCRGDSTFTGENRLKMNYIPESISRTSRASPTSGKRCPFGQESFEGDGCGQELASDSPVIFISPQPPPSFAVSYTDESYLQITDERKINRKNESSKGVEVDADNPLCQIMFA